MFRDNAGTDRGKEDFNRLQSLKQQAVGSPLTLINQSATALRNTVITVYCWEDVIRLLWAFLFCRV